MIIFMGLAGSGKSTMGQLLAAHLHCPWVSTSSLLRQAMDQTTKDEMLKGKLVNDEQTLDVLDKEFHRIGTDHSQFVLDGSPRTMRQAKWLVKKDRAGELKITAVIHLDVEKSAAKQRLLARHRPDDHEQAITERFHEYDEAILPIINYLNKEGFKVHEIDANQPPDKVSADILKTLGV